MHIDLEAFAGKLVVINEGIPALLKPVALDSLIGKFQRNETAIENKLYRALHEFERLQRGRKCERYEQKSPVLFLGFHSTLKEKN